MPNRFCRKIVCSNTDARLMWIRGGASSYEHRKFMNEEHDCQWMDVRLRVYRRYNLNPKKIARFNELLYISEIMMWYIDMQWINNYMKWRKQWNTTEDGNITITWSTICISLCYQPLDFSFIIFDDRDKEFLVANEEYFESNHKN